MLRACILQALTHIHLQVAGAVYGGVISKLLVTASDEGYAHHFRVSKVQQDCISCERQCISAISQQTTLLIKVGRINLK